MGTDGTAIHDMRTWMRTIERRLLTQERRPQIYNGPDLLGPGFGPTATEIIDWNDDDALNNGFFWSNAGNFNTPDGSKVWVGITIAEDETGHGIQQIWSARSGPTSYMRRFTNTDPDSIVPTFTAWIGAGAEVKMYEWSEVGASTVMAGTHPLTNDEGHDMDVVKVRVRFTPGNGPVGADYIANVMLNGSPLFSTGVTVPDGSLTATGVPDLITAWPSDDYLTIDRTQVGSTSPGTDVVVTVMAV